eukprot:m.441851 g.441851  ORF g.441851 m.441851 type:complete len:246 (-) comp56805_c1_seq1:112-849(-)
MSILENCEATSSSQVRADRIGFHCLRYPDPPNPPSAWFLARPHYFPLSCNSCCSSFGRFTRFLGGGAELPVTEENKMEFIRLKTKWLLNRGVGDQTQAFLQGFAEVMPTRVIQQFDEMELEMVLRGLPEFDIADWEQHTVYEGYDRSSSQIVWFWMVIETLDNEKRGRLLQFVTGSCRLPIEGFRALQGHRGLTPFTIYRIRNTTELPTSHTCFNRLDLPSYGSMDELRAKLLLAIEETEGFGIA